jgi:hypothetical protein
MGLQKLDGLAMCGRGFVRQGRLEPGKGQKTRQNQLKNMLHGIDLLGGSDQALVKAGQAGNGSGGY